MGIENIKDGMAVVSEIMKIAEASPHVKTAANEVGKTALTVTKAINNFLLPIAAVNYGFDKARQYFSRKFENDFSEKTKTIPTNDIIEPKASIAGPALQGLAFSHEEPSLKEMYLNLLALSVDRRFANNIHPAFVEIVRQLNSEEAALLSNVLSKKGIIPIAEVRLIFKNATWKVLHRNLINVNSGDIPQEIAGVDAMLDNWQRLGLVDIQYDKKMSPDDSYGWIKNRPEFIRLSAQYKSEEESVDFAPGIMTVTSFGQNFAKGIGLHVE